MKIFTIKDWVVQHEVLDKESLTVPDQAYTIEQLMERHRAGVLTDVQTRSYFHDDMTFDDDDVEEFGRMDIFDKQQLYDLRNAEAFTSNAAPLGKGATGLSETEQGADAKEAGKASKDSA